MINKFHFQIHFEVLLPSVSSALKVHSVILSIVLISDIPASFWTNPQYRVKIDKLFTECSMEQGDKNMLVSLMQKPDKRNRRLVQNLHIGFTVFEVYFTLLFPASNHKSIVSF